MDDRRIAKITSQKELDAYENFGHQLRGAIPRHWMPEALNTDDKRKLQSLAPRSPGRGVIVLERLGADIPERRRKEIDIKIGSSTASFHELQDNGFAAAAWKKTRMTVADFARGSRSVMENRGYRVCGYKSGGLPQGNGRLELGRHSTSYIDQLLDDVPPEKVHAIKQKIGQDLHRIQQCMNHAGVTFIGPSLLLNIDTLEPSKCSARLIDLAHPIAADGPHADLFEKYRSRFDQGLASFMGDFHAAGRPR